MMKRAAKIILALFKMCSAMVVLALVIMAHPTLHDTIYRSDILVKDFACGGLMTMGVLWASYFFAVGLWSLINALERKEATDETTK
jgi:hypothetical protein